MVQINYIGRSIPPKWLLKPHYTVGRSSVCDIQLDDENVLNIHANLRFDAQLNTLIIEQENNGEISVNNHPISGQVELKHGDIINISSYNLMISDSTDESSLNSESWQLYKIGPSIDENPITITTPAIIGRSNECEFYIEGGQKLSRRHARLSIVDGELIVQDLDSSNGTFLNNTEIEQARLSHNDVVSFADVKFRVKNPSFNKKKQNTSETNSDNSTSPTPEVKTSVKRLSAVERQLQAQLRSVQKQTEPAIRAPNRQKKEPQLAKKTGINKTLYSIYGFIAIAAIWTLIKLFTTQ